MESKYLFAYGTLQPEHARDEVAHLVQSLEIVGKGTVRGTLYDMGEYPGAVLDPASSRCIHGTVFALPDQGGLLHSLDSYEEYDPGAPATSQFIRRLCPVQLTDGEEAGIEEAGIEGTRDRVLVCWVYEYNRPVNGAPVTENGSYKR